MKLIFPIAALQAQQFDLYRDDTYIKSFWENSMIDEETDSTKEHTYYIMAKNSIRVIQYLILLF
ncbi:hypothetical protein ACT453_57880, partial [Bacillus sp. D-CC]